MDKTTEGLLKALVNEIHQMNLGIDIICCNLSDIEEAIKKTVREE